MAVHNLILKAGSVCVGLQADDSVSWASSVTQYGITWNFSTPRPVGQFVNGDWWVVGPVTITSISPTPSYGASGRNGSMVNPTPGSTQAYDSRAYGYNSSHSERYIVGTEIANGSSLISTNSKTDEEYTSDNKTAVRDGAILTVLASPPDSNAFRPGYCGSTKTLYSAGDMDVGSLPSLSTSGLTLYDQSTLEGWTARPWIDHVIGWSGDQIKPSNNLHDYSREHCQRYGDATGHLCLNLGFDKTNLAIYCTQIGIDFYTAAMSGMYWPPDGGEANGRIWPILFAGYSLQNPTLLAFRSDNPDVKFGEIDQTFYIAQADVDRTVGIEVSMDCTSATSTTATGTLNAALDGYNTIVGNTVRIVSGTGAGQERIISDSTQDRDVTMQIDDSLEITVSVAWTTNPSTDSVIQIVGYESGDIGTAEWGLRHTTYPSYDNPSWVADYRQCCTATAWASQILASRILGMQSAWDHNAIFDYQDRYMDTETNPTWRARGTFAADFWDTYRDNY